MVDHMKNKKSRLKSLYFASSILVLLFVSSNVSLVLGIDSRRTTAVIPILFYLVYQVILGNVEYNKVDKKIKIIICVGLLSSIILSLFPQGDFRYFLTFSVTPFCIYAYFDQMTEWERKILRKCLLFFFLVESGLAIYERVTYSLLIDIKDELTNFEVSGETWTFRSQALFGHPLANSLIVSTINVFVLASDTISNRNKYLIFLITFIAILCFNSRGNIIVVVFTSLPFLFSIYRNSVINFKIVSWLFVLMLIVFIINLQNINLGGRLFNVSLDSTDSSTMARLVAFDIFNYIDSQSLLWGMEIETYLKIAAARMDVHYIENGIVTILLRFGLIFGLPLIILFIKLQYTKLNAFGCWQRIIILLSFYIIGFSNPHLTNPIQWIIFFFALYAFEPQQTTAVKNKKN